MTDIHDIKGKVDIINYMYLIFFLFVSFFVVLFYFILNKFLNLKDSTFGDFKKEQKLTNLEEILQKISNLENKLENLESKSFYEELNDIFFDFLFYKYQKDFRKKTEKELEGIIKDTDILDFYKSFYYKSFIKNKDIDLASKRDFISKFRLLVS